MPGGIKCRGRTGSGGPNKCVTFFCRLRSACFLHPRPRSSCHLRSSGFCTNPYSEYPPAACFGAPPLRETDPQRSCKCRIQQCLGEWCLRISQRVCQSALEKHSRQESCLRGRLKGQCQKPGKVSLARLPRFHSAWAH